MGPLVSVVAAGELGEGAGAEDGLVVGAEGGVYDKPAVEDQEGVVDALEGVVVCSSVGEVDEHLTGRKKDLKARGLSVKAQI